MISPAIATAALPTLVPFLTAAFFPKALAGSAEKLPTAARLLCPSVLALPYLLVACSTGIFHWGWLGLYALLPVAVCHTDGAGPAQRSRTARQLEGLSPARRSGPGGRSSLV